MEEHEASITKGEMTRQRIVAEAAALFNQRGFAGASMQDVMAATGLEKGGVYRHFSSKEELAAEAFRYALARAVKLRTEKVEGVRGAVARLRFLVERFVEAPSAVAGGCPLMNTAIDSDDGNLVLRELARNGIADWKRRLRTIVEDGIREGEIRKRTDPGRVANTIVATLEGALMISRLEGTKQALNDARASLESMLEDISTGKHKRARLG